MVLGGTANMSGDRRPSERPSREMEDDATSPLKQKTASARRGARRAAEVYDKQAVVPGRGGADRSTGA
jgi:hypothetical protein